jgi:hypothetical protein
MKKKNTSRLYTVLIALHPITVTFTGLDFQAISVVTSLDFPAVSIFTGLDFPALSVATSLDFPAVSVVTSLKYVVTKYLLFMYRSYLIPWNIL